MANDIFKMVVSGLEVHVGDILALGVTKNALRKLDSSEIYVTPDEMKQALKSHIGPALLSFMSPDMAKKLVSKLIKQLPDGD